MIFEAAAVLAILALVVSSSSSGDDASGSDGAGKLPLSGRSRSDCPSIDLPRYAGPNPYLGDVGDMPVEVRKVYQDAIDLAVSSLPPAGGEIADEMRRASAHTIENLGLQAECAGYLAAAKKLYKQAREIRGTNSDSAPTTASMLRDLGELPLKVREYVLDVLDDPTTTADELLDGASKLTKGCTAAVEGVWTGRVRRGYMRAHAGADVFPTESDAPADFASFSDEEMKGWCYPTSAAVLRDISKDMTPWSSSSIARALLAVPSEKRESIGRVLTTFAGTTDKSKVAYTPAYLREESMAMSDGGAYLAGHLLAAAAAIVEARAPLVTELSGSGLELPALEKLTRSKTPLAKLPSEWMDRISTALASTIPPTDGTAIEQLTELARLRSEIYSLGYHDVATLLQSKIDDVQAYIDSGFKSSRDLTSGYYE